MILNPRVMILYLFLVFVGCFSIGCIIVGSNPIEVGDFILSGSLESIFPATEIAHPIPAQIDYSTIPQHVPSYEYFVWNESGTTRLNVSDDAILYYAPSGGGASLTKVMSEIGGGRIKAEKIGDEYYITVDEGTS